MNAFVTFDRADNIYRLAREKSSDVRHRHLVDSLDGFDAVKRDMRREHDVGPREEPLVLHHALEFFDPLWVLDARFLGRG